MPSAVVANFHYNPNSKTLTVVYASGNIYEYKKVPETVYHEMKNAFSKGSFLNEHIKGRYEFEKKN